MVLLTQEPVQSQNHFHLALLRQTAEVIEGSAVRGRQEEEVAVIAPGLDAIARYTWWKS